MGDKINITKPWTKPTFTEVASLITDLPKKCFVFGISYVFKSTETKFANSIRNNKPDASTLAKRAIENYHCFDFKNPKILAFEKHLTK